MDITRKEFFLIGPSMDKLEALFATLDMVRDTHGRRILKAQIDHHLDDTPYPRAY